MMKMLRLYSILSVFTVFLSILSANYEKPLQITRAYSDSVKVRLTDIDNVKIGYE
jgi:hypothetical protein